jgi:hypothetical protein
MLKEEGKFLRVIEIKELRGMIGPNRNDVTAGLRRLRNEVKVKGKVVPVLYLSTAP